MKNKSIKPSKKRDSIIVGPSKIYDQINKSGDNWPTQLSTTMLVAIKDASASLPDLTKCTNAELDILIFAYEGIIKSIKKFKK